MSSANSFYKPILSREETHEAVAFVEETFRKRLCEELNLIRVAGQMCVLSESGLNDDLANSLRPVRFTIKAMDERPAEIVRSLSKWKRLKLMQYRIPPGKGLCADANAIRSDEKTDRTHSIFVDQWDWERTLLPEERTLESLKFYVRNVYGCIRDLERRIFERYPCIIPCLPDKIVFVHAEELLHDYPELPPSLRESEAAKKFGAVFVIGIGGDLGNGTVHDDRDPDSDDWSSPTENGFHGLNGDIIFWNPTMQSKLEISSMGIRVDAVELLRQLELRSAENLREREFQRQLLGGDIPSSIGGGIGRSRLAMFMLRKIHIGEVHPSVWPEEIIAECERLGIPLM